MSTSDNGTDPGNTCDQCDLPILPPWWACAGIPVSFVLVVIGSAAMASIAARDAVTAAAAGGVAFIVWVVIMLGVEILFFPASRYCRGHEPIDDENEDED